jgi:hypothetical protein
MAGEQKGKAYEAFTKAALEALRKKGVFKGDIFWDEKAAGMTIVPDLTIGPNKDHPHTVILITHSGSAKNSDMKYWRNIGELAEIKVLLPVVPKVFNLAFDSVIKENLKKAQAASFDGQLIVGDLKYGTAIQEWIDDNLGSLPKDKNEKVEVLTREAKTDKKLKLLLHAFSTDLETLLKKKAPPELEQVWAMERQRAPGRAPRARDTFVRRGLSKLLIIEDLDAALRLYGGQRVRIEEIPEYAFALGLATKAVGRASPNDVEVENAVVTLGVNKVRSLLAKAPMAKLEGWLVTLRNASHLLHMGDYVHKHYKELCDPSQLAVKLKELHQDPWALSDRATAPNGWPPTQVWLLEYLVALIRESTGTASGYGYAQLGRDVVSAGFTKRADGKNPRIWVGGFIMSDWVHRRGEEQLDDNSLFGIASVLCARLKVLDAASLVRIAKGLPMALSRNIIEAKLCTYRGFEPLLWLIKEVIPTARVVPFRSCFAESAGMTGQASQTHVMFAKKTVINWQSASNAGRDHKKKELCGRAVALRYSWDSKLKKFIPRQRVEKLILVVDGTWRREDLLALARAGWDEIFYPDEMDRLAAAIV